MSHDVLIDYPVGDKPVGETDGGEHAPSYVDEEYAEQALSEPDRNWDGLLVAVSVYMLAAVARVHQLFAFLEPTHLPLLAASAAIALLLMDKHPLRQRHLVFQFATMKWMLVLVVLCAFSVPGALWAGGAFDALIDLAKSVGMAIVVIAAVRGKRDVARLAGVYFAGAVLYAFIIVTRFRVGGGSDWRLGNLYYYDANDFSAYAVSAIAIGLFFLFRPGHKLMRLAALGGTGVLGLGFTMSGSRGGFLAIVATAAFLLFRFSAVRASWRALVIAVCAVGLMVTASDAFWAQMKTIVAPENDYNVTEEGGRINVWKRGITYMMDHPITGVGAENFAVAEGTISPMAMRQEFGKGVKWGAAHNSFVQVGAELGVGGLIVFIAILTSTLLALRKADLSARDSDPPDKDLRLIAQSMGAGFFGFTTGAFFLSFAYREPLYTLIALAIGAAKVTMARQDPAVMYESDPGLVADTMSGDPMVGA